MHRGNFGGYVIFDQLLRRNSGSSDQGLGIFLRAGGDPGDRNLIEFHADAGLSDAGLLPGRDNDVAGIAMSYERISDARSALVSDINAVTGAGQPPADFESALELSYQAEIAPWWVAQPDVQVILHPNARLPNLAAPRAPDKLPDAGAGHAHRHQLLNSAIAFAMGVMGDDAGIVRRHHQPVLVAQGALGVLVAALPVLAHRGAENS